ncbi:MAG: hypothetical protein EOM40_02030 [Clostridia bacterium]|nr:hypothetical protein [Clostridia bacterium]
MERRTDFIKVKAAYRKMKTAETMQQTIYIYGVTGYGKTTMVQQYLVRTRHTYLVCTNGYLTDEKAKGTSEEPLEMSQLTKNHTVVVDDLQFLKKSEERKKVLELIENPDIWVILIARCRMPGWLQPVYLKEGMLVVPEKELFWSKEDIQKYFLMHKMELTEADADQVYRDTYGNPLGVRIYLNMSREAGAYHRSFFQKV